MNTLNVTQLRHTVPCDANTEPEGGLKTVLILPDGVVETEKGTYILDQAAADEVIANFEAHGVEVPIDFNHQSLKGGYAPAAGWITKLFYEKGRGLSGLVRWNPKAKEAIRAGAFQYLSPAVNVYNETRRAESLHSAALTNKPAIPRMERIAASNHLPAEKSPMNETETIVPSGAETAPKDDTDTMALQAEVKELRTRESKRRAKELVQLALSENKLSADSKTMMAWGEKLAATNPVAFEEWRTATVPFMPVGRTDAPNQIGNGNRTSIIANAVAFARQNPKVLKLCSLSALVNNDLLEANLETLTEPELKTLVL